MPVLTASPFHPSTGALLTVYRDAYLRGDLAAASMQAVADYLQRHPEAADEARAQWQALQHEGEVSAGTPVPWEANTTAKAAAPRARWLRLPHLWMFGLFGAGLTSATAYGVTLLYQHKQIEQRGPVFQQTEHAMETASAFGATSHQTRSHH